MDQFHILIYYDYLFLSNKVSIKYNLTYLKSYIIQSTVLVMSSCQDIASESVGLLPNLVKRQTPALKMGGGMILIQVLTSQSTLFQSCCHVKISPLNLWDFYLTWANNELKSCIKLLADLPQRHKAAHLLRGPQWAGA